MLVGACSVLALGAFAASVLSSPRSKVVRIAKAELGSSLQSKYTTVAGGSLPAGTSWCGIFVLWALRKAKLTNWHWEWGWGFISKLPTTSDPQPGDIAFKKDPYQHQALVEKAKDGYVWTINGNSDGGKVVRKVHPIGYWDEFRSIDPLIRGCRDENSCLNYQG